MKRHLLLIFLVAISIQSFAAASMATYRWRNNDGNEKTATWLANQNTPIKIYNDNIIRFRAQILYDAPERFLFPDKYKVDQILTFGINDGSNGGEFAQSFPIDDNPNTTNPFYLVTTNSLIHGQPTTQQLSNPYSTTNYGPGRIITKYDTTLLTPTKSFTELEWVIKPTKYALPGRNYFFTTNMSATSWFDGSSGVPYLSVDESYIALSKDSVLSFSYEPTDKNIAVKWVTALTGHNKIEIQSRKADSPNSNWSTLAIAPGNSGNNYSTTIKNPDPGVYLFRFKLFDSNNVISFSKIYRFKINTTANLSDYAATIDGNKVKLTMTTTYERFNNGFKLIKSTDGSNWTVLYNFSGSGTKSTPTNYVGYDKNPANGKNYYQLMYIKEGYVIYSDIRMVDFGASQKAIKKESVLNIYPNPTSSNNVSFDMKGYKGKTLNATLTNLQGRQIANETFSVNTTERYTLKNPLPQGTYILNIKGDGLAESGKVLIP